MGEREEEFHGDPLNSGLPLPLTYYGASIKFETLEPFRTERQGLASPFGKEFRRDLSVSGVTYLHHSTAIQNLETLPKVNTQVRL